MPTANMSDRSLSYRNYDLGTLTFYDVWVLGVSCTAAWGTPLPSVLLPFFRAHFSDAHLDIGVGTGYFPATVLAEKEPDWKQALTIWDLSTTALQTTKERVEAVAPHINVRAVEADCASIPEILDTGDKFDSISASMLIHCIPQPTAQKAAGLARTAASLLSRQGVFYGCTVLGSTTRKTTVASPTVDWLPGGEVTFNEEASTKPLNWFGLMLMWFYNRSGIFTNWADGPDDIVQAIEGEFEVVESWVIGRVLLFRARVPRVRE